MALPIFYIKKKGKGIIRDWFYPIRTKKRKVREGTGFAVVSLIC